MGTFTDFMKSGKEPKLPMIVPCFGLCFWLLIVAAIICFAEIPKQTNDANERLMLLSGSMTSIGIVFLFIILVWNIWQQKHVILSDNLENMIPNGPLRNEIMTMDPKKRQALTKLATDYALSNPGEMMSLLKRF